MDLDRYEAILCDLDGCLISGNTVLPGAAELIALAGKRLYVVSNNSTDTPETLGRKLAGLGLEVPAGRIVLAGVAAVDFIAETWPGGRLALYGTAAIRGHAEARGLVIDQGAPDAVLLTRDLDFSYAKLAGMLRQLEDGAALVVSNGDLTHPGPDGVPVPETGALLAAVEACRPDLAYRSIGKPAGTLFLAALERAGAAAEEAVFIGDNPETDGRGARAVGLPFLLIDAAGLLSLLGDQGEAAPLLATP